MPNDQSTTSNDPNIRRRRSVLDVVMNDAASLRNRLGTSDQQRLDQHLEGVHSLERRLSRAAAAE